MAEAEEAVLAGTLIEAVVVTAAEAEKFPFIPDGTPHPFTQAALHASSFD